MLPRQAHHGEFAKFIVSSRTFCLYTVYTHFERQFLPVSLTDVASRYPVPFPSGIQYRSI